MRLWPERREAMTRRRGTGRWGRMMAIGALAATLGCGAEEVAPIDGDPETGARVIGAIGCGVCHVVPGVPGPRGTVGPSLEGFAHRAFIAGAVPNRPDLLVEWVGNAPALVPDTAMPALPLSEQEARDVAAYLYTLR